MEAAQSVPRDLDSLLALGVDAIFIVARLGSSVARENTVDSIGRLIMVSAVDTSAINRAKYQYSLRLARPEKSAYLRKQVLIAVMKFIKSAHFLSGSIFFLI